MQMTLKDIYYGIKNFLKNLYNYRRILWRDKQFDYGYLLDLEKTKLQLMIHEFKINPHVDHTSNIRWLSICIKLIDIIQEEDFALEYSNKPNTAKFRLIKYVNISNSIRFGLENIMFDGPLQIYMKQTLRQRKALYLYNRIRYNYIFDWWD